MECGHGMANQSPLPVIDRRAIPFPTTRVSLQRALPVTAIQKHHFFKCAGNAELYIGHYSSEHPLQKYQVLSHETADTNEDASDDINAAEPTTSEIPRYRLKWGIGSLSGTISPYSLAKSKRSNMTR